jgi:hypothetical protein
MRPLCGQLERVLGSFTATPTDEEWHPPPFRLTIVRQVSDARACLAHNMPSPETVIKGSAVAAVTLITLAALLLHKSPDDGADGDRYDGAMPAGESRAQGGVMIALIVAAVCVAACLYATGLHCLSDSPPADPPGEGA